ncbi:hypothetical protein CMV_017570 [Castanea mollissima]|uniref:Uncharacterized protein n=1 Tax=Castanea mollissima TaxID=60419 RepID=A0A8J4VII2_9ROSI|nr:hypothetical protein CMV_017570 [Castanea mollissima]
MDWCFVHYCRQTNQDHLASTSYLKLPNLLGLIGLWQSLCDELTKVQAQLLQTCLRKWPSFSWIANTFKLPIYRFYLHGCLTGDTLVITTAGGKKNQSKINSIEHFNEAPKGILF